MTGWPAPVEPAQSPARFPGSRPSAPADALFVAVLTVASLAVVASGRATLDLAGLALLFVVVATGLVSPGDARPGFSNPTIAMLAGLYVLAEGLTPTGALDLGNLCTSRHR